MTIDLIDKSESRLGDKAMRENRKKSGPEGLVLVVGDWVIDEYWMLVQHQSRISSHTGFVHYRVASQPDHQTLDLCGAGHSARILAQSPDLLQRFNLVGLGIWNDKDTEYLLHLLHSRNNPDCESNKALFRHTRQVCGNPPPVSLHSLASNTTTTRVIRLYHREPTSLKQINRIDWELPRPKDTNEPRISIDSLGLPEIEGPVIIAVSDLRKGVVTEKLVDELSEKYPDAIWCARTKDPEKAEVWVNKIPHLFLFLVGPEVAAKQNPWDTWIANGKITLQALNTIKEMPGKNAILVSHQHEFVARIGEECLIGNSTTKLGASGRLGWSPALFTGLVESVALCGSTIDKHRIKEAVRKADREAGLPLNADINFKDPIVVTSDWETEESDWRDARKGFGFLRKDSGKILDVWRGTTLLPGYVACIEEKEKIIRRIGAQLRSFKNASRRHSSLSILLQADPGAGKTFLARSLADAFGFFFVRSDITQMIHRDDLLELLDTVATRQANEPDSDLLVFVDEINAQVDGAHVYSSFLIPLEEGYYIRRGNAFALRPCVWIFAGTDPERSGLSKSEKYSDFESRVTSVESLDFDSLQDAYTGKSDELQNEARLEQVYLGALLIHRFFPDVTLVSKSVLKQFFKLNPEEAPSRKIRRMCEVLRDVQYGEVSKRNCEEWTDAKWDDEAREFIRLRFA